MLLIIFSSFSDSHESHPHSGFAVLDQKKKKVVFVRSSCEFKKITLFSLASASLSLSSLCTCTEFMCIAKCCTVVLKLIFIMCIIIYYGLLFSFVQKLSVFLLLLTNCISSCIPVSHYWISLSPYYTCVCMLLGIYVQAVCSVCSGSYNNPDFLFHFVP